ncbi:CO dehydrogenase/acetyl-CoA synthase complex subunit alpha [Methanopyrus kandleri]
MSPFELEFEGLKVQIGSIEGFEPEGEGPLPCPTVSDLADWDRKLFARYRVTAFPICDMCCMCTYGRCNLAEGRRGACGIDIRSNTARFTALKTCIGAACHAAHARHLVEYILEKLGDVEIDLGSEVDVMTPIFETLVGFKPKTVSDLEKGLEYIERELTKVLSSVHVGQEMDPHDYESKALHAGMIDNLALEIADVAQIAAFDMPKGEAPLVEFGPFAADDSKPCILLVGHNVAPGTEVLDYLEERGLDEEVEVLGICCTAWDVSRVDDRSKVIGPLSRQLHYVRMGIADVVVLDEQCIRADIVEEANEVGSRVIATRDLVMAGLPDVTDEPTEKIIEKMVSGEWMGVFIEDLEKAAEVAVEVAIRVHERRKKEVPQPDPKKLQKEAKRCLGCGDCERVCPNDLPIVEAMERAANGDFEGLADLFDRCVGCARCESECPAKLRVMNMIEDAWRLRTKEEKYIVRTGRGPIKDVEIRQVGGPIVMGDIPGVVAFVACPNYPDDVKQVGRMVEELLERNYIVLTSGCTAMALGMYIDEDGKTLYEKYEDRFDAGCLVNTGSCVSNAHILGACIKIAAIFAKKPLKGNFKEIADYILNRIGACGVLWGTMSQKALAISTGFTRWGIPIVYGPAGLKYQTLYIGDLDGDWTVYDARTGKECKEYCPIHLKYAAEDWREALVQAVKLCIRPNDTPQGRQTKLQNYIELYKEFYNELPPDLPLYVRDKNDVPITLRDEVMEYLEEVGWKPRKGITEPTLLEENVRG